MTPPNVLLKDDFRNEPRSDRHLGAGPPSFVADASLVPFGSPGAS
jgi:hypothetical protein